MMKNCPFCGDDVDESNINELEAFGALTYYVCCDRCGSSGPVTPVKEDAVELWNRRYNKNGV